MMAAIMFDDFSYAYRGEILVLKDISLTVPRGSFTVITGPSGAGKTTLCLAVCGAVPHYYGGSLKGKAAVNGVSTVTAGICQLSEEVGTVLEDYEVQLVTTTVEEEVAFSLENRGLKRSETARRVKEALAIVRLTGLEKREVTSLSGGQKQRLAIAAVLAAEPSVLVLDEPASALDPEGIRELYSLLGRLNREQGITIFIVEHDLSHALPYLTQLVYMEDGRIACAGAIGTVLAAMWRQSAYKEGVPPLWRLKLELEAAGATFGQWRSTKDALAELENYLDQKQRGEEKSA